MRYIAAFTVLILTMPMAPAQAQPYVSCIDGHVVQNLSDCPQIPKHNNAAPVPIGGGGGNGGGLLGLGIGIL